MFKLGPPTTGLRKPEFPTEVAGRVLGSVPREGGLLGGLLGALLAFSVGVTDPTSELQPGRPPEPEPNRPEKGPEWGFGASTENPLSS